MSENLPKLLKSGEHVRLFSVVSEGSREKRALSNLLSCLTAIPALTRDLFATISLRTGTRTHVEAYTEVVLSCEKSNNQDRPDGLLIVRTGRQTWTALIESKIGNSVLNEDQVKRYAEMARDHNIDAVITISNEFVARPTHHPIKIGKSLSGKVKLFHWSWVFIQTQAYLLHLEGEIKDKTQSYLLHELVRFLNHQSTGIARFNSMNKEWRDVVRMVQTGATLSKNSDLIQNTIGSWHQETKDLCLLMSRIIGRSVKLRLSKLHRDNPSDRARDDALQLVDGGFLKCVIDIPDAASALNIVVDLRCRTIVCNTEVGAPEDKARSSARVNWIVRQLAKTTSSEIIIKAKWLGRAPDTQETLIKLRDNPNMLNPNNDKKILRSFEILMVRDLAGKFSGSRTFIDTLEQTVPLFYEQVGQYIKQWRPTPPKPLSTNTDTDTEDEKPNEEVQVDANEEVNSNLSSK